MEIKNHLIYFTESEVNKKLLKKILSKESFNKRVKSKHIKLNYTQFLQTAKFMADPEGNLVARADLPGYDVPIRLWWNAICHYDGPIEDITSPDRHYMVVPDFYQISIHPFQYSTYLNNIK